MVGVAMGLEDHLGFEHAALHEIDDHFGRRFRDLGARRVVIKDRVDHDRVTAFGVPDDVSQSGRGGVKKVLNFNHPCISTWTIRACQQQIFNLF